jgi:DNA-binding NtrC family response regulator
MKDKSEIKILLVDDDPDIRDLCRIILKKKITLSKLQKTEK